MSSSGGGGGVWEGSLYRSLSVLGAEMKRVWSDLTEPSGSVSFVPYHPSPPHPADQLTTISSPNDDTEASPPANRIQIRNNIFIQAIQQPCINLTEIQTLAFQGIPEHKAIRSTYWKILLKYLPLDTTTWNTHLETQRNIYKQHKEQLIDPINIAEEKKNKIDADDPLGALTAIDDNTNQAASSNDLELYREIEKDILRTHSMLHFFSKRVSSAEKQPTTTPALSPSVSNATSGAEEQHPVEKRHQVLLRIMYIYAKLHPDVKYIQGMNEILAPLYFVFAQDVDPEFSKNAEADCFFCFSNLMNEIKDRFLHQVDNISTGSFSLVDEMMYFLRQCDPELCEHLDRNRVDPRFYAFRWLTLLLSQEFPLPDVLRIWDSLFADPDRFQFLTFICCAMLECIREKLLQSKFAEILPILQQYPNTDVQMLIEVAIQIRVSVKSLRPVLKN